MIEKILFYGGLNSDDEDRFLPDGDYRYALNIRNSKGDKSSQGAFENTKGNAPISFTLPNGINKCIGGRYDDVNNRVFYFIYNNLSSHSIYEYNVGSGGVTLIMQSSALNFDKEYPILSINIIDDLMYWTDKKNPPRKINIERARSGGYTTIDEQSISRIQYAPNYSPLVEYGSDVSVNYNKVRGKMFQFKYSYVYEDNEISAFSPVSKIAIPPNQIIYDFDGYYELSIDNHIAITLNTGNFLCKRIQIIARESNNTDWYIVKELDKDELNIDDDDQYIYKFFNDEIYLPITQASANRLFDFVPLKVGAQELVDGNRMIDSDITEGYDNITVDAEVQPFYNIVPPSISSTVQSSLDTFGWSSASQSVTADALVAMGSGYSSTQAEYIRIDANTINTTDQWNITCLVEFFNASQTPAPTIIAAKDVFIASFPTTATSQDIAQYFADAINNSTQLNGTTLRNSNYWRQYSISLTPFVNAYVRANASVFSVGSDYAVKIQYYTEITFSGSTPYPDVAVRYRTFANISSNIIEKTFKHNSKYSAAFVYYDAANRSGVCQVSDSMDVKTQPYSAVNDRGHIEMDFTIKHRPPSWAKVYQILFTENRTTNSYLQIDTGTVLTLGGNLKIYINTIGVYNIQNGNRSSLSYSWAKGDRVTFIKDSSNNFFNEYYDTEIISSDTDGGGQFIITQNVLPTSITNGALLELYSPKLAQEQVFYWECGEVYPITNGFHTGNQQTQTSSQDAKVRVSSGDTYYRYRGYNIVSFIEDSSLSDWYTSNSWDKGRFNIVDKEYKQIRRYATSYYSEQFVPDTNINGLSTIYDTSFHEANKNYGAIQITLAEQDRLLFFQELRTGFSLVNKNILYNSDGTPNGVVGQDSQVLSDVNYYNQPYGIGNNPESLVVSGTRKYHVDENTGYVLRLSVDGYTEISEYKYHNFFTKMFNQRKKILPTYRGKIWGVYDTEFDEYVLFFDKCKLPDEYVFDKRGGRRIIPGETLIESDAVAFSEVKKRWVTHYGFNPEAVISYGVTFMSFNEGVPYLQNTSIYNNFFGIQGETMMETVANAEPSNIKFFSSLFLESTDVWSVDISNQFGQQSELDTTDFELNEGVYYAAFLKDVNTPNVPTPLIEGDDLRCHSLNLVLINNNTDFVKTFAVNVRFGFSELTNK